MPARSSSASPSQSLSSPSQISSLPPTAVQTQLALPAGDGALAALAHRAAAGARRRRAAAPRRSDRRSRCRRRRRPRRWGWRRRPCTPSRSRSGCRSSCPPCGRGRPPRCRRPPPTSNPSSITPLQSLSSPSQTSGVDTTAPGQLGAPVVASQTGSPVRQAPTQAQPSPERVQPAAPGRVTSVLGPGVVLVGGAVAVVVALVAGDLGDRDDGAQAGALVPAPHHAGLQAGLALALAVVAARAGVVGAAQEPDGKADARRHVVDDPVAVVVDAVARLRLGAGRPLADEAGPTQRRRRRSGGCPGRHRPTASPQVPWAMSSTTLLQSSSRPLHSSGVQAQDSPSST